MFNPINLIDAKLYLRKYCSIKIHIGGKNYGSAKSVEFMHSIEAYLHHIKKYEGTIFTLVLALIISATDRIKDSKLMKAIVKNNEWNILMLLHFFCFLYAQFTQNLCKEICFWIFYSIPVQKVSDRKKLANSKKYCKCTCIDRLNCESYSIDEMIMKKIRIIKTCANTIKHLKHGIASKSRNKWQRRDKWL